MPGPPNWISSVPVGQHLLVHVIVADAADAARQHDGLVVAAPLPGDGFFEGAEIAGQIGAAEFVVERRGADRAFEHDRERR